MRIKHETHNLYKQIISNQGEEGKNMKTTTILAVVLGVLVLISIVQAFQLYSVKGALNEGNVKLGGTSQTVKTATGSSSGSGGDIPANIQNLPNMVGGC